MEGVAMTDMNASTLMGFAALLSSIASLIWAVRRSR